MCRLTTEAGSRVWTVPGLCLLVWALTTPAADGQQRQSPTPDMEHGPMAYWSLQLENDLWGSGDDRYYTHGTEITFTPAYEAPEWLKAVGRTVPGFVAGDDEKVEIVLGQKIFTPDNIEQRTLIRDDRPYAGWLYGGVSLLSMLTEEPDRRSINTLELTLGIVGPSSLAEDVQREWHDVIGADEPRGWDHQLHNEIGVVVTYTRMWEYFVPVTSDLELSASPHVVAALGNVYTHGAVGAMTRFGQGLRGDIGPSTISPGFPGAAYFKEKSDWGWYVFAGLEARLVGRNIFLDGNTFEDSHSVDKKPLVFGAQIGFAVRWQNVRVSLTEVLRSEEFDGQDSNSEYGALNLTVLY